MGVRVGKWQLVALLLLLVVGIAAAVMSEDDEDLQRAQALQSARKLREQTKADKGQPALKEEQRRTKERRQEPNVKEQRRQTAPQPESSLSAEKRRELETEQQRQLQQRQQQQQKQKQSEVAAAAAEKGQKHAKYELNRQQVDELLHSEDMDGRTEARAEQRLRESQSSEVAEAVFFQAQAAAGDEDFATAKSFYKEAARAGHAQAMAELGRMFEHGLGVDIDFEVAFKHYNASAALGLPEAQRALAFMLETGKGTEPNIPLALLYYTFAARGKDVEAQHVLAYKYMKGYGVMPLCSQAAQNFRPVAEHVISEVEERGYDITQTAHLVQLAEYSRTGEDAAAHDVELLDYIHFAAQNGDATSQGDLGRVYLFGLYHEQKDYAASRAYLEMAHEQGDAKAAAFLGKLYEFGYGVDVDIERAADLYREASDGGSAHGHCFLGKLYKSGKSSTLGRDYTMAIKHLQNAMSLQNYDAAVELGLLYYNGQGVSRNYETAFGYFRNAALHDNAKGQLHTARMLHYGIGTPSDCGQAVQFYNKLCTKGSWRLDFEVAFANFQEGDVTSALLTYEKLAERGMVEAQTNVAWLYDTDRQPEQFTAMHTALKDVSDAFARHRLALKYYKRSADQGSELSHLKLGDYHYYGLGGLAVDYRQAAAYYRHVSAISPQARFNLGYMHHHGLGLDRDLPLAKRFYDDCLAAEQEGFLPVKLALLHLAADYAYEKYQAGELDAALVELFEYVFPSYFAEPPPPTSPNAAFKGNTAKGTGAGDDDPSLWDEVLLFGLQLDTVVLFLLGGVLLLVLMMRNQVLRVRVQRGRARARARR